MRYLVTLTPLEPYLFGGDITFGKYADKEEGSYIVKSTLFPQQSAILGMLRKEIMTQAGLLTRKRKGEWVDNRKEAEKLVSSGKFNIEYNKEQDFKPINKISPVFLLKEDKRYIKKVDIDNYSYKDGKLLEYDPKVDIYDNYISIDHEDNLKTEKIFKAVEQIGNKKGGEENSLFKKISYSLNDGFKFAFYLDCNYALKNSIVFLGADRSSFKMEIQESNDKLEHKDKKGFITLLGDAYIKEDIECEFAITSEVSYRNIQKTGKGFKKSDRYFLYERGSVFLNPTKLEIDNKNLQKIGYNIYSKGEEKWKQNFTQSQH